MSVLDAEAAVSVGTCAHAEGLLPVEIVGRRDVAEGVLELEVRAIGERLPDWQPGAHIDLHLQDGLIRQYSLCGDPEDREQWRVAVLREPEGRGGSAHVHDVLAVGQALAVSPPRNNFTLDDAPGYVFVAGGIGITPLLPMIRAADARGRPWRLTYGGRRRSSMAYVTELQALASGPHGSLEVVAQDTDGLLDLPTALASGVPGALVYCCGPAGLLDAVEKECATLTPGVLRVERFGAKEVGTGADKAFEVELARSSRVLQVGTDQTVLDVLLDAGIDVDNSCREGVCGSCETAVLGGDVEHRDSLLSQGEKDAGDVMFVCVSRCTSARLVLDL